MDIPEQGTPSPKKGKDQKKDNAKKKKATAVSENASSSASSAQATDKDADKKAQKTKKDKKPEPQQHNSDTQDTEADTHYRTTEMPENSLMDEEPIFIDEVFGELDDYGNARSFLSKGQKLTILGSAVFLIAMCSFFILRNVERVKPPAPIGITGEYYANMGIYDPSVVYDAKFQTIWMAYSAIQNRADMETPDINVNIASSFNGGRMWNFKQTPFKGKKGSLSLASGSFSDTEGLWRYETPSLVHDPSDTENPWKLYAYKYFWTGDIEFARKYSAIVYKEAPSLHNPSWSKEKWLFAANPGQLPSPYNSLVKHHLNALDPSLKDIKYYSEPAGIYVQGAILMALTAFKDENQPDRIIMIASTDHGETWSYLGDALTSEQAKNYGDFTRVGGPSLVFIKDKLYLTASFGNDTLFHQGTHVFEFENALAATLKMDKNGIPHVVKVVKPIDTVPLGQYGAGQSAYVPELKFSGMLMPHMDAANSASPFKIYGTKEAIVPEED